MSTDWLKALRNHPQLRPPEELAGYGGNRLLALLAEYAGAERLSRAELDSRQRMRLRALARHCAQHSPHFAARLKAAGLTPEKLAEPGGLHALPPLTRRALVDAGDSLFCASLPPGHGGVGTNYTSGSTGEPVSVRRTGLCQQHQSACGLRFHLWHRHDFSARVAMARARITEEATFPDWGAPASLLFKTGPAATFPATRPVAELVQWLVGFAPHLLLIIPSRLTEIVAELDRSGHPLPGLRVVRTIGETVTSHLRDEVRRVLGLEIQDGYSSEEAGSMAIQCPEAGTYHVHEHIRLEVVDADGKPCAPGQTGRVLVTDLINFATPLIRYEIGDYAEVGEPCPCGRGLASIRRFLGRERNLMLLPDGTRQLPVVSSRISFHRWRDVFPVRQFQLIQEDRHTITAKMSADGRPSSEQEARLTTMIQAALGHPFTLRYEWQTEPLPRGPGGKFEEFQCRAT